MFGSTSYMGFFGGMFAEVENRARQQKLDALGIEKNDGFYGSKSIGIEFKYSFISLSKNIAICSHEDSDLKDLYQVLSGEAVFLFTCFRHDLLGNNMFLVQVKDGENYALFGECVKLTNFIYKSHRFLKWNDGDEFGVLSKSSKEKYSYSVIVNRKGEEIIESNRGDIDLKKNIACIDGVWWNVLNLSKICSDSYKSKLESEHFLFVETSKNTVYKISKNTGSYEFWGDMDESIIEKPKEVKEVKNYPIPTWKKPKVIMQNRNDVCACGSGLKYKKCCLFKTEQDG
jgi:hypothetical protein